MAGKIGEEFVKDFIDRGRRELASVFYQDSPNAQPLYPLRGGYAVSKEAELPDIDAEKSVLEDKLALANQQRDDKGRDDRDMDRE